MELLNIPSLITVGDGNGGQAISSLREYLNQLISANSIASFLTHKIDKYGDASTGAIRVRIPRYLQSFKYNPKGGNPLQEYQVSEVIVPIDVERMIKSSVDDFDLRRFEESGAYQVQVLSSVAKTIIADLNAHFYQYVANEIANNKQNTIQLDFSNIATSQDELASNKLKAYQLVQFINGFKKIFNTINYSLEDTDITTVLDDVAINNIVYGFTTGTAGDKAIDIQVQGSKLLVNKIGGLTYTRDNMISNNVIPAGVSFNGDEDFDFSNITAISIFAGAVAFPYYVKSMWSATDPDTGNLIVGSKYLFGAKSIYPQFIWAAVKDNSNFKYNLDGAKVSMVGNLKNPTTLKVVGTSNSNNIPLSEMGNLSVASSDENVATATIANGVITITKVANGVATISLTSDNEKVKGDERQILFA